MAARAAQAGRRDGVLRHPRPPGARRLPPAAGSACPTRWRWSGSTTTSCSASCPTRRSPASPPTPAAPATAAAELLDRLMAGRHGPAAQAPIAPLGVVDAPVHRRAGLRRPDVAASAAVHPRPRLRRHRRQAGARPSPAEPPGAGEPLHQGCGPHAARGDRAGADGVRQATAAGDRPVASARSPAAAASASRSI